MDEANLQLRSLFEKARGNVNVRENPAATSSESPSASETQTQIIESQNPSETVGPLDSAAKDEVPSPSTTITSMPKDKPKPAEEIFSLDVEEVSTTNARIEESPIPVEEIFSLDADEAQLPAGTQSPPVGEPIPADRDFLAGCG